MGHPPANAVDLVLRNARTDGREDPVDIAIGAGKIAAIAPAHGVGDTPQGLDVEGRYVCPGFDETQVHLDKSRILDRCTAREGTLAEAIREVANADAHAQARRGQSPHRAARSRRRARARRAWRSAT
jgi:cytosine/adenosine deaminase-related metal-dependent hydrolase